MDNAIAEMNVVVRRRQAGTTDDTRLPCSEESVEQRLLTSATVTAQLSLSGCPNSCYAGVNSSLVREYIYCSK